MDTFSIIILSIFGGIIYTFIITYLEYSFDESKCVITPWILRDYSTMNWFGCWFLAIIIRILNPVWSVMYFIYWITHIKK